MLVFISWLSLCFPWGLVAVLAPHLVVALWVSHMWCHSSVVLGWPRDSDVWQSPWLPNELQTKQPIICVHKQLINALNMSNYVYLAVLAKFHAGQLCSAGLNCLLRRLNAGLGFSPVETELFKNKIFHFFFFFLNRRHFISHVLIIKPERIPLGNLLWCSLGIRIFLPLRVWPLVWCLNFKLESSTWVFLIISFLKADGYVGDFSWSGKCESTATAEVILARL